MVLCVLALALTLSQARSSPASAAADRLAVTCSFADGCTIDVDGSRWSTNHVTKTRANGKWCSSDDGTLEPKTTAPLSGSDSMGDFSGTSLLWSCGGVPYETAVRVYNTPGGDAAVFSQRWPAGAAGTALGLPKVPGPGGVQEEVASVFPSISPTKESGQKYMVVYNQMVGGMADGTKYGSWGSTTAKSGGVKSGTMAGPMVFFSESGQASSGLVLTPITHAMETNLHWDNESGTLNAGILGSVAEVPVNYTTETMLFRGPSDAAACAPRPVGAGCAVHSWGTILRKYKGKDTGFPAGGWDADKTLSHLGYYSDNGAYYYYYTTDRGPGSLSSFGADFREVKEVEVDAKGIPMRYLQIDSYWYYKINGGVSNWTATPDAFPGGLKKLSADTGWKYVAHNRYWSPAVAYAKQNGGKFDFIIEKGHNAIPTSQAFWDYLMASSKEWGMAVYEQDWLHNEWEGMNATLTSATLSTEWLHQMGAGATKAGVTVQYCMAYGRHTVASAEIPSVNQIRASDDYATGVKLGDHDPANANLYVGASSLFAAALGLAPSKDVFWSNSTQRYPRQSPKGHSPRYADAHEPFPELQTAVALLSAGPVGPGDKIGAANTSLLLSTCRRDGLLLKPGYPAVAHDSILAARAAGGLQALGELNVAYSEIGDNAAIFASIIGMDLLKAHVLSAKQLGFPEATKLMWFNGRSLEPTAFFASSVTLNRCGKADFQHYHITKANQHGGPTLMGEVGKIVPHSPMRFSELVYRATDATVKVTGVTGETVVVWFDTGSKIAKVKCSFAHNGTMLAKSSASGAEGCH